MAKKATITAIVETALSVATNKNVRKTLFGVYSDNTPRSFTDCLDGEFLSPKDKEKYLKKKKKGKKKKKKNKKKMKIDL